MPSRPSPKRPIDNPVHQKYAWLRKRGMPAKEALQKAKKLAAIQELKTRFPLLTTKDAANTEFERLREKALEVQLQQAVRQSGGKPLDTKEAEFVSSFVHSIMNSHEADVAALAGLPGGGYFRFIKTQEERRPSFFARFIPKFVQWRKTRQAPKTNADFFETGKAIRKMAEETYGKKIDFPGLERRIRDYFFEIRAQTRKSRLDIDADSLVERTVNERKLKDTATQRNIIDIAIRGFGVKKMMLETVKARKINAERVAREFVNKTYPDFEKKPQAIQQRILQEATANARGIIGLRSLQSYIEWRLAKRQTLLKGLRDARAPEIIINRQIKMTNGMLALQKIFSKPENIRYAVQEIAHLFD